MRAFSHIPLMQMENPTDVLVICFGVGSTAHSASLHPTVKRLEIVDLSRNVLEHAAYFQRNNRDVLSKPRTKVFVNDGRQHLWMQPSGKYDLITLEPPPISFAGVANLYSSEFYRLARDRLRANGYISQWLPAYQVHEASVRSIVRSFVDIFPQAVLLAAADRQLILLGKKSEEIYIVPEHLQAALAKNPAVARDLARVHLATPTEIIGTFLASAETLARAVKDASPVTDDNPIMEYSIGSINACSTTYFPKDLIGTRAVASWCPACFSQGEARPEVRLLPKYLTVMDFLYRQKSFTETHPCSSVRRGGMVPLDPNDELFQNSSYMRTAFERRPR